MSETTVQGRSLVLLAAGFIVWSVAFVALYAMLSVGCAYGWDRIDLAAGLTLQRVQLIVIFLVHLGAGLWLALALRPASTSGDDDHPAHFLRHAAYGTAIAAVAATAFTFAGIFALTSCY